MKLKRLEQTQREDEICELYAGGILAVVLGAAPRGVEAVLGVVEVGVAVAAVGRIPHRGRGRGRGGLCLAALGGKGARRHLHWAAAAAAAQAGAGGRRGPAAAWAGTRIDGGVVWFSLHIR